LENNMKDLKTFEGFINEGRPEFQDTPNALAYSYFKKWANKNKANIKNELTGIKDGTELFMALRKVWMGWANRFAKEWSYLHSTGVAKKDFGRALAVMLKKDDLIITKSGNKLTELK
tara:strand:+ start:176 stop:526 length:351 start_codon:yes stop_codon:yes gene_type:complete